MNDPRDSAAIARIESRLNENIEIECDQCDTIEEHARKGFAHE